MSGLFSPLAAATVSGAQVVEVDLDFGPVELRAVHPHALGLVVDEGGVVDEASAVDAAAELPGEQIDSHDAKDQPEDQTHQQHVHDGRDRADQSVHDHLKQTDHSQTQKQTQPVQSTLQTFMKHDHYYELNSTGSEN